MNQPDLSTIDTQIGAAIRTARMQAGLKQAQLSAALGIDRTTLSNYERGSRSISIGVLVQIAYELRVPLSAIVPHARAMEHAWGTPDHATSPDIQHITHTLARRPYLAPQVAEFLTLLVEREDLESERALYSPESAPDR